MTIEKLKQLLEKLVETKVMIKYYNCHYVESIQPAVPSMVQSKGNDIGATFRVPKVPEKSEVVLIPHFVEADFCPVRKSLPKTITTKELLKQTDILQLFKSYDIRKKHRQNGRNKQ